MTDENQQVVVTDQNADQDVTIDQNIPDDSATPEQVKALKLGVQTLSAQKKHWRDKAVDPDSKKTWAEIAKERAAARVDQPKPQDSAAPSPELQKTVDTLVQSEQKRTFAGLHGLSPEATDKVFAAAKGMGVSPEEAIKDNFVRAGVDALNSQARVHGATPGPSNRSPRYEGKTFAEMTPDERRKNFGNVAQSLSKRN